MEMWRPNLSDLEGYIERAAFCAFEQQGVVMKEVRLTKPLADSIGVVEGQDVLGVKVRIFHADQ